MCGIIDSGSWNTCHNQTGMKNCGFAICSSLMMREIVCSFIIIFKHFDVNFWDKDPRQGCNVSQIQTKKTKFLTLAKKPLYHYPIWLLFLPSHLFYLLNLVTNEFFSENIQNTAPPSTEGLLVWTPYPSGNSNIIYLYAFFSEFWPFRKHIKITGNENFYASLL